jgi:hypothetical protein
MARADHRPKQTQNSEPRLTDVERAQARALAPAYDYIRAVVTHWRAERAERERASGNEQESA